MLHKQVRCFTFTDGFFLILPVADLQPVMRDTVTFDVGSADGNTISLDALVLDDRLVEGTESITLVGSIISGPSGASFIPGLDRVTFNILDNDSKFHPLYRHITVGKYNIHAITQGNDHK